MKIVSTLLILSSLFLSGCFHDDVKPIKIETTCKPKIPLNIENPEPVKMRKVEWIIITPENYKEVFTKLEKAGYDVVLFGLTDDGYKNLSLNSLDIRNYINMDNYIINSYKTYYESKDNNSSN